MRAARAQAYDVTTAVAPTPSSQPGPTGTRAATRQASPAATTRAHADRVHHSGRVSWSFGDHDPDLAAGRPGDDLLADRLVLDDRVLDEGGQGLVGGIPDRPVGAGRAATGGGSRHDG